VARNIRDAKRQHITEALKALAAIQHHTPDRKCRMQRITLPTDETRVKATEPRVAAKVVSEVS
jgi:hypothetical protein